MFLQHIFNIPILHDIFVVCEQKSVIKALVNKSDYQTLTLLEGGPRGGGGGGGEGLLGAWWLRRWGVDDGPTLLDQRQFLC